MQDSAERPLRIGAVNYLNSKPLIEGLTDLAPTAELILDYPSRLADQLLAGTLDVGLVPSIACLLEPHYEVVSDACVAARGPVLSVKLYFRKHPADVRSLALDAGSRTSATLARILLAERFGILPDLEPLPLDRTTTGTDADAVLLIGDRAIEAPAERFSATWDLGEEWTAWTGLPFVFAMWGAQRGRDLGNLEEVLSRARDRGCQNLSAIARREAPLLGLSEQVTYDYLTQNLYYRLGPAERQGLARFHQLAVKHELAPRGIDLVFRHCACA
ncbi:MAG: menaquinone biosynthesis protein [Planctomycetes bacterium]|nr:menaquinone biosynthesis protein [Planctomycetota bacterium]